MKTLFSVRGALATMACLVSMSAALWAQESGIASPSLGDLAREGRAQHATADDGKSGAQDLVDDMQRQQEESANAPVGFSSFDAGNYRLFVPYPSSLEGRENGGAVLLGSQLGVTNTEVLAGTPIPIPPNLSDIALLNLVRQVAGQHGQFPSCSAKTVGSHKAFRCYWNNTPHLLGREVWGTMEIVVASNSLIPVMCVSPDDLRQCVGRDQFGYHTCNNRNPSWAEVQRANAAITTRFRDELTTGQMCDQIIYPSIQLKEDIVIHPASIAEGRNPKQATAAPAQDNSVAAGTQTGSLAELARQTRQAPHAKAQATLDNSEGAGPVPPGFQSFAVMYCSNPQQCSQATVVIPEKVEIVSSVNGQHIFKTALKGSPVYLYAGPVDVNAPYRSLTAPDYIRIRDLANSNNWSREKTDGVSTQELTIDGRPALVTRFRYEREPRKSWIGERTLIQDHGKPFLLGCTAAEENFADAEALCTTLVNSLRFQ